MKNVNLKNGNLMPEAYVTKQKQRVKQYPGSEDGGRVFTSGTVYLKNGDNFEIELFNPTQEKLLATIELNGKEMGSGIVLRPGERVFLERHLNEPNKFVFETYDVKSSDKAAMEAIEKNGKVKISFKKEQNICLYSNITWTTTPDTWTTKPWYEYKYDNNNFYSVCEDSMTFSCTNTSVTYGSNKIGGINSTGNKELKGFKGVECNNTLETGRIEKGGKSNQEFSYDYSNFESYPSYTYEWTILPESRKAIVKEDIVLYCESCGRRKRANERYCPSCGHKF